MIYATKTSRRFVDSSRELSCGLCGVVHSKQPAVMPGSKEALLDKDWGAKIPDYITKGTFSIAVFFMSLTMRGGYPMCIIHVIVDSADLSPLLSLKWQIYKPF